jgi:glycosyltransferase involved in cell wall biosynthesis
MADAGWQARFLSARITGTALTLPNHPNISESSIAERPSHVIRRNDYVRYLSAAGATALRFRPEIIYASDPLGAAPGLLAARLAHAKLVYHEHDSPTRGGLNRMLSVARGLAARSADLVIFPNEGRARIAENELRFDRSHLRIVWNLPRRAEVPEVRRRDPNPIILYYHGSIGPKRIPEAVVDAIVKLNGRARLKMVGYEAPGAEGYLEHLMARGIVREDTRLLEYHGPISRGKELLSHAASAHLGLAFMPLSDVDVNMQHMTGASNKVFDYMASGLPLLVSDLPDWNRLFVDTGYGRACDPMDSASVRSAILWFLDNPEECIRMGERARNKIMCEWNYDTAFQPILREMENLVA